jgi:glutamine synthetase
VTGSAPSGDPARYVSAATLHAEVAAGEVDTVELVLVDMHGRLQGKRIPATHFVDHVMVGGTEVQSYLLATDVDMNTIDGFSLASWESGYGNLLLRPDNACMRRLPWHPRTVLTLSDAFDRQGVAVSVSPRQMLRRQLKRLSERGWAGLAGTELEFQLFTNTYEEAWRSAYQTLHPATDFSGDYSMLDTRGNGALLADLSEALRIAGVDLESVLCEAAPGQHEAVLACRDPMTTADNHALAKFAAKNVAARATQSVTFMAKLDQNAGNACHVHFSLRDLDGVPIMAGSDQYGFSSVMRGFLAGQLAYLPELTFFFAPNINSYKRFVDGSYAPTAISWGFDNRTCALRVVGSGPSLRLEHRLAGADVNPYLALTAIIAAGLRGVDEGLQLEPALQGNAYSSDLPRVPSSLRDALTLFRTSDVAAEAMGDDVVRHYTRMGEVELEQFAVAVTDWEKFRGFERL